MDYDEVLATLKAQANPTNVAGMNRFGIRPQTTVYGISVVELRKFAKTIGKNHALALQLWNSGVHEARIIATVIADPKQVTEAQMGEWVQSFDSWDICDQCCLNLFRKTAFAHAKAIEWSAQEAEFVKRAGFTMMATLAVHDKKAADDVLAAYLTIIEREAGDERNFVKKAVNWALRQIGKRNANLNTLAIQTSEHIQGQHSKAARWIAKDALRELQSEAVQKKIGGKV
ncbi:MAG: DNA alkylation repair protein [Anaerolineae bacterium]|nr:DNA alkylation repair protein [Anaerolineae bacterium]